MREWRGLSLARLSCLSNLSAAPTRLQLSAVIPQATVDEENGLAMSEESKRSSRSRGSSTEMKEGPSSPPEGDEGTVEDTADALHSQRRLMTNGHDRPEGDDCTICFLPIEVPLGRHSAVNWCCSKRVCDGCLLAAGTRGIRQMSILQDARRRRRFVNRPCEDSGSRAKGGPAGNQGAW